MRDPGDSPSEDHLRDDNQIDVRYGSLADIPISPRHVRFTPNNGLWAAHPSQHLAAAGLVLHGFSSVFMGRLDWDFDFSVFFLRLPTTHFDLTNDPSQSKAERIGIVDRMPLFFHTAWRPASARCSGPLSPSAMTQLMECAETSSDSLFHRLLPPSPKVTAKTAPQALAPIVDLDQRLLAVVAASDAVLVRHFLKARSHDRRSVN